MIITILPNSQNFHAVAYNEHKVSQGLAELLEVQNFSTLTPANYSADNFRQYFDRYSKRNVRIQNAQFHFSVSCKGKEFTHKQLVDIAHMYLKEMGYADEGQPLLIYAHHDTPNNHIHVITSRIAPDGHKIEHDMEKKRSRQVTQKIMEQYTGQKQEPTINEVAAQALVYRFTTKAQYCAILQSQGYECKDDSDKPIVHLYKGGEELGTINVSIIMQHALRENNADEKRRRQLMAIMQKYRNLTANKEELAAAMKKKFGASIVYLGRKDNPYGYFIVDHKNKTVHKGSGILSIKELLQFEDARTRFAKIDDTINSILADDPDLTTRDINRILYRQFGTRIHNGGISWDGITVELSHQVREQLRHNYLVSVGKVDESPIITRIQQEVSNPTSISNPRSVRVSGNNAGSRDINREHEVGGSMDMSVDDEQRQKSRWKR